MKNKNPLVSVILPIYNCEQYLPIAIDSILNQSFQDFELILINDGSTDDSEQIAKSFRDPRITFISQKNMGLARTLNHGIELARGEFIARQDQDDVSHPERLARQVAFMQSHKKAGMVGSWARIIETDRVSDREHRHPVENADLKFFLCFNNPFVHSSVLIRKTALLKVGGYTSDSLRQPEDYELWLRIAKDFEIYNLPEFLLDYREVRTSMSRSQDEAFPRVPYLGAEYVHMKSHGVIPYVAAEKICKAMYGKYRISRNPEFIGLLFSFVFLFFLFRPNLDQYKSFFKIFLHTKRST